jgi:MoxR-like ATPase
MTSTDRSRTTAPRTAPDGTRAELDRAAAELEALADAHEDCTHELDTVESTVDALLDDRAAHVLVLDGERRVTGLSRGMAALLGDERSVLGRRVTSLVPPSWTRLDAALDTLTATEGWRDVPLDEGAARLCVRRATDDDHPAVYVVRYERPDDEWPDA